MDSGGRLGKADTLEGTQWGSATERILVPVIAILQRLKQ